MVFKDNVSIRLSEMKQKSRYTGIVKVGVAFLLNLVDHN